MSKKIVSQDIPFGAVYAYRRGDTIEDDAVNEHGWQDFVVDADSKEGREAQGIEEEDEPAKAEPAKTAAPQPASVSTGKEK